MSSGNTSRERQIKSNRDDKFVRICGSHDPQVDFRQEVKVSCLIASEEIFFGPS